MRENSQTPLPAYYDPTGLFNVHSVFPTIQGEGPFSGERALFIRLHGCNLRCPGCDTEYTAQQTTVTASYMLRAARLHSVADGGLIVVTGGEPLRQNIAPAVNQLLDAGYRVQSETNGVLEGPDELLWHHPHFTVVCSPKTKAISQRVYEQAAAFKYVIQAGQVCKDDGLPLRALMHPAAPRVARPRPGTPVFVQPMDEASPEANALNLAAAIRSAMDHGHRLQLQIHKILNME